MKLMPSAALSAFLLAGAGLIGHAQAATSSTAAITAAVADPARPEADRSRDAARKPVETLEFSGVKPGDAVADFNAGSGYFTRLFADVVGKRGQVYAMEPVELQRFMAKATVDLRAYATQHRNTTVSVETALDSLRLPRKLDLFFISQNYHDLHDTYFAPLDIAAFNKAVFDALKPGGIYLVLDHSAAPGAPADVTQTLHRIDPEVVRRELQAAGFIFEGESKILANPADPRTISVFDKTIQGHTDQFIFKFRKPAQSAASPPPTAMRDGAHDFDFNIGQWKTHIKRALNPFDPNSPSIELDGTVTVRKVWDGRAQLEEIEADSPKGHWEGLSLFLYNPQAHQWSQSFANSRVGTLSANIGEFRDGRVVLIGQDTVQDRAILVKAVWSHMQPTSHHYEEWYSGDGGATWVLSFTADLNRLQS